MSDALLTDLYGLNMAASYLKRGMDANATFSLFVREASERGYLVAGGLEPCLEHLEQFAFDEEDVAYLASIGFDDEACTRFAGIRFTGDMWAVPEGHVVFSGEPLLEVTAPIAEGQLVESFLLNQVTLHTMLATKAARCMGAVGDQINLVEFGLRRAQGIDAGNAAARAAVMVGFTTTSNVEAARELGLQPAGTMAHSYIEAFPSEVSAFRAFAEDRRGPVTFLVDTYDTETGLAHAIDTIRELDIGRSSAVRLDSGDLLTLSRRAREMLDAAGLEHTGIFVSGGLDEEALANLVAHRAPVDTAGLGTRVATSADAPYLDTAYKLVAYDGRAVLKLSQGKATLPGAKQVFRAPGLTDVIGLRDEPAPAGSSPLLEPVIRGGRRVTGDTGSAHLVTEARRRFEHDLKQLPAAARHIKDPQMPQPAISAALAALDKTTRAALSRSDAP